MSLRARLWQLSPDFNYCECSELLLSLILHPFSGYFSQLDVGVLGRGHGSQHGQAFTSRITPVPGA